jgi:hypothetical protein
LRISAREVFLTCHLDSMPRSFFDDVEEARFYKSIQNLHTRLLYEVELVDPAATKHQTDWRNISPKAAK